MRSNPASTSSLDMPWYSTNRSAPASASIADTLRAWNGSLRAMSIIDLDTTSTAHGPVPTSPGTAAIAACRSSNAATARTRSVGSSSSVTSTAVMSASVPSDPARNFAA